MTPTLATPKFHIYWRKGDTYVTSLYIDSYYYRSVQAIMHTLGPHETLLYTWDDHTGKKLIKWDLLDVKVNNGKPINVNKVNRIFVKRLLLDLCKSIEYQTIFL